MDVHAAFALTNHAQPNHFSIFRCPRYTNLRGTLQIDRSHSNSSVLRLLARYTLWFRDGCPM